ncbi:MAG: hypothetical protein WCV88_02115 [Patescibacteria group bacterium]|jgi:hypothetical protein
MKRLLLLLCALSFYPASLAAATAGSVHVVAHANDAAALEIVDRTTIVKQIDYLGLDSTSQPVTTEIEFSGTAATPQATVKVSIPAADIAQLTEVDSAGKWSIALPTQALTPGNYYAYVSAADITETNKTLGLPVAYFTVLNNQSLSVATWIFLVTSGLAIFALLLAITLQLRYNAEHHPVL